jgi:glycosyltransferase involved in cell wall biosynthesis
MIPVKPIPLGPLSEFPLVSVLISNYNYAQYLDQAIESVLAQTYENFEIVVCDDGSTDSSPALLERYKSTDSRIKTIYQSNGGQSLALNAAFSQSAGEIICLLDADDVFLPEKLQMVVNAFAAEPGSGFAVNRMLLVDQDRNFLAQLPSLHELPSGWQSTFLSPSAPGALSGLPATSGLSLRRSAAEPIFPLPAALKVYSDQLIQVVAPLVTPIVAIETPLSEYRIHGANSAGVGRYSEALLRNIVIYEKEIWKAWRAYLSSPSSGIPVGFPLPAEEMPPTLMVYACARFGSGQDYTDIYRAIPKAYFDGLPALHRWYLRASQFLPRRLFQQSFDLLCGQQPAKMRARRISHALRNWVSFG